MPLYDGTGPLGLWTGSGRRRRRFCSEFSHRQTPRSGFKERSGCLLIIALPLFTAVIRDLMNPSGVFRQILHSISIIKIPDHVYKKQTDISYLKN